MKIRFHQAMSCVKKLVHKLVQKSTSEQLQDFREILLAVYHNATKGEFDEKDIEAIKQLLKMLEENNSESQRDRIQLEQIEWLKYNLRDFIRHME